MHHVISLSTEKVEYIFNEWKIRILLLEKGVYICEIKTKKKKAKKIDLKEI